MYQNLSIWVEHWLSFGQYYLYCEAWWWQHGIENHICYQTWYAKSKGLPILLSLKWCIRNNGFSTSLVRIIIIKCESLCTLIGCFYSYLSVPEC